MFLEKKKKTISREEKPQIKSRQKNNWNTFVWVIYMIQYSIYILEKFKSKAENI